MSRGYLLDTNIVSRALKGESPRAAKHMSEHPRSKIQVSVITEMELRFGLAKHPAPHKVAPVIEQFLRTVMVAALPADIAKAYGAVRADLERRGRPIGPLDTIIAAHAVASGFVLVTNNVREFGRVRGLRCEDWS